MNNDEAHADVADELRSHRTSNATRKDCLHEPDTHRQRRTGIVLRAYPCTCTSSRPPPPVAGSDGCRIEGYDGADCDVVVSVRPVRDEGAA